ncbi:MAG: ABC transporter ATP-binding protein [Bacteroidota bacterium]|nr:ABC transporter ATP-binding protein [Bacteroidota bacterium]
MKSLIYLNKYFLKYKWRLLLGVLFVGISNYFAVDGFIYAGQAVDFIRNNINNPDKDYLISELVRYAAIILGLALLSGVFLFFTRQTIIVMSRLVEYDLKNEIFAKYQQLDIAFYKRNNTGDMMNRISEDVGRVRMYIGPAVMYILNTLFRFILTITAMLHVNAQLTLYVLIPLPLLAFAIYIVSYTINKKGTLIQETLSDITTHAQEAFSGIRVLKTFGREDFSVQKFEEQSAEYRKRTMGLVKTESLFQPIMILLIGLSNIFIVYIGGKLAIEGKISFGNIVEFILYVNALTWPIASLGWVTSLIQRAAVSQTRINEFLQSQPEIYNSNGISGKIEGDIEFKNVSFTYPDSGIQALNNISFNIKKGSSVAIIGRTGSGKSTIANLICRLYDVNSGEIVIDNKNIKSINLFEMRSQTGYVPQEVFLFSDTISNNIGFSMDEKDNKAIEEAAKNAAIYDNIMDFSLKFETIVGERGITLSGGQKQRISIARAIIKQPQLLIFDDCLSAIDTETEEKILHNLKKIMQGKTSVIISHRVSSVKNSDTIIVLDQGQIIEQGNHRELINKKGSYYELFKMQQLEEELMA